MQQQARQRQTRERQSTPLPEKRGRKRQTTHSSHANTTHRHMVNHTPPFHNNRKDGARRKAVNRKERTQQGNTWCSGITCVLAKLRAHYPEHQQQKRQREKRRRQRRQATRPHTHSHPPPPFHNPHTNQRRHSAIPQPCHKDTTLNQQYCDGKHKGGGKEMDTTVHNKTTHHRTSPLTTNMTPQDRSEAGITGRERKERRRGTP